MLLFTNFLEENDVGNFTDVNGDGFDDNHQPEEKSMVVPHHIYSYGKYSNIDNLNWKSFDPDKFLRDSPDLTGMHVPHAAREADDRINVIKNWAHHHSGGEHYDPNKFGKSWIPGTIESRMANELEKLQNIKNNILRFGGAEEHENDLISNSTRDGNAIHSKSLLIGAAGGALGTAAIAFVNKKEKELNNFIEREKEKEFYKNEYERLREEDRIRQMVENERRRQGII